MDNNKMTTAQIWDKYKRSRNRRLEIGYNMEMLNQQCAQLLAHCKESVAKIKC